MTAFVPRQNRRCTVYPWCTGHRGPSDIEHRSRVHHVAAREGRELHFALTALADGPLRVTVEVVLSEGGPPMDVAELDQADVLQAAATLRRMALEGREHSQR